MFFTVIGLSLTSFPQSASASNVNLNPGQTLNAGQSLNNGTGCLLIVQANDGNLVEYCNGPAVWNSESVGYAGDYLAMQTDGNVVLYRNGQMVWTTATSGYGGAVLTLQDDHNIVVYQNGAPLYAVSWIHDIGGSQTYSQKLFVHYGWNQGTEWPCLLNLWNRESGWRWSADNPSSHAYGIPQSLPANKMAVNGTDWHDNGLTQIQWGENYISGTYGTPCNAWSHEQRYGWY